MAPQHGRTIHGVTVCSHLCPKIEKMSAKMVDDKIHKFSGKDVPSRTGSRLSNGKISLNTEPIDTLRKRMNAKVEETNQMKVIKQCEVKINNYFQKCRCPWCLHVATGPSPCKWCKDNLAAFNANKYRLKSGDHVTNRSFFPCQIVLVRTVQPRQDTSTSKGERKRSGASSGYGSSESVVSKNSKPVEHQAVEAEEDDDDDDSAPIYFSTEADRTDSESTEDDVARQIQDNEDDDELSEEVLNSYVFVDISDLYLQRPTPNPSLSTESPSSRLSPQESGSSYNRHAFNRSTDGTREKKFVLLGGEGVGKSALATQLVWRGFEPQHVPSFLDFQVASGFVHEDTSYQLEIADSKGFAEQLSFFPSDYINNVDGILVVYSLDHPSSLAFANSLLLRLASRGLLVPTFLVANKTDLAAADRRVTLAQGQQLAAAWNIPLLPVSAMGTDSVVMLFRGIITAAQQWASTYTVQYRDPIDSQGWFQKLRSKLQGNHTRG